MRRTWPFVVAVAAVGGLAGAAIAGRPTPADTFKIDPSTVTTVQPTGTTTTIDLSTTTIDAATETSPDSADATDSSTTQGSLLTTTTTTTAVASPSTTLAAAEADTVDRADVRLVIANGDGRFNLAGANADRLRNAGYVNIDVTDVGGTVPGTIVYYRPGFDDEAALVAGDLGVPDAVLQPLPDQSITVDDSLGDIVVVLGPDALR